MKSGESVTMFLRNGKQLAKQLISYLRRVIRSHEITDRDVCQYFRKSIVKLMYSNYHHAVIRRRLLPKGNKVFIQHNYFKYKSISKERAKRWKRKHRELAMSWSNRVVLYKKRQRAMKKIENREKAETILQPEELRKLNERIRQYKNSAAMEFEIVDDTLTSDCLNKSPTDALNFDDRPNQTDFQDNQNVNSAANQLGPVKGTKFLDSLINKLTKDSQGSSSTFSIAQRKTSLNQPRKDVSSHAVENALKVRTDDSESSNSSDFFGFTESDLSTGLLATPLVPKKLQSDKSAFVSECLDAFLRENSLENRTTIELPKIKRIEEGMVCEGAQPPRIQMQKVPDEFGKARTVAQKRIMMERKRGVKFLIIENENSVYRELMKRSKTGHCNQNLIATLQDSNIPFTRDCWKASSWLLTPNGRFCFQAITANGKTYKLVGSRGNHLKKVLGVCNKPSPPRRRKIGCPPNCEQSKKLRGIQFQQSGKENGIENSEKNNESIAIMMKRKGPSIMEPMQDSKRYKPCPLSKKRYTFNLKANDCSDSEVYEMPSLQLEVFPQVNQPLDERIKPYLNLILPSENISREWAEFAVSTLVVPNSENNQMKDLKKERKSFTFNVPYVNNQKTVLVRKIRKCNEKFDEELHKSNLGFTKNINPTDDVQVVCGNILTQMIDSVALSLSEDSLIKIDPGTNSTLDESKGAGNIQEISNLQEAGKEKASKIESNRKKPQKRMLLELKRLNATIVKAQDDIIREINKCTKDYCKYGCVCQSLSFGKGGNTHCNKPVCMFKCSCQNGQTTETYVPNGMLSKEDALIIREKATARLAKVEKEFCSTVVLTDNQTYLLNDSPTEKRRTKRIPKRFTDFIHEDLPSCTNKDDSEEIAFDKAAYMTHEDVSEGSLLHCNVSLRKLDVLHDLEPWCMIHCLYKCYCNGEATEGEPFKFEQKDAIETEELVSSRKRRLPCDKEELVKPMPCDKEELVKPMPYNAIKRKYYASGYVRGSRTSAIPSDLYKKLNRGKIKKFQKEAAKNETSATERLLQMRIMNSSANKFLTYVADSKRKQEPVIKKRHLSPFEGEIVIDEQIKSSSEYKSSDHINSQSSKISAQTHSKILSNLGTNFVQKNTVPRKKLKTSTSHGIIAQETNKSLLIDRSRSEDNTETELETDEINIINEEQTSLTDSRHQKPTALSSRKPVVNNGAVVTSDRFKNIAPTIESKIPIISSVVSLNAKNRGRCSAIDTKKQLVNFLGSNTQDIHRTALANLNIAVTRTMQAISTIQMQSKGPKDIPKARPATLFNLRWDSFLKGYCEGSLFTWEVCIKNHNILVATKENIMPQIPGAMFVANIKFLSYERLPLLGKMLRDRCLSDKMKNMFVLLAGQNGYWSVIGMINREAQGLQLKGVVKPTPNSHPEVSAKVNFLYQQQILIDLESRKKQQRPHHSKPGNLSESSTQNMPNFKPMLSSRSPEKPQARNSKLGWCALACNLKLRPMTRADASSLNLPIPIVNDHNWLIMDLKDDFSHIYVPEWKDFLTYDRIKKSLAIAMKEMKTVRMGNLSSTADVYVTPDGCHRLYVGPFFAKVQVNFVLCRNVNGKIITREEFEKNHKTHRMGNTMAYWLTIKNSKFIYENAKDGYTVATLTDDSNAPNKRNCILSEGHTSISGQNSMSNQSSNSTQETLTRDSNEFTPKTTNFLCPKQKSDKVQSFAANRGEFRELTSGLHELGSVSIKPLPPLKSLTVQEQKLPRKQQPTQPTETSKIMLPSLNSSPDRQLSLLKRNATEKVAGHFVNDEIPSYKIPAEKYPNSFILRFDNPRHCMSFPNEERVNLHMSRIKKTDKGKWRFVAIKPPYEHNYYAMKNLNTSTNTKPDNAAVSKQNSSNLQLSTNGQTAKKVEQLKSKAFLDSLLARRVTEPNATSAPKVVAEKEKASLMADAKPNVSSKMSTDVILIED